MWSLIITIGLVCAIGGSAVPAASRTQEYRSLEERVEALTDSNAIAAPEISDYLMNFFSRLTPSSLSSLLRSNSWAEEKPYEFPAEPDPGMRTRGYQELYNEFLASRNTRS